MDYIYKITDSYIPPSTFKSEGYEVVECLVGYCATDWINEKKSYKYKLIKKAK